MRNASGHFRDETRWPLLPLAAPRGAKELLWHGGVLLAVASPLVPPAGFLVFGEAVALTWLFNLQPRELVRFASEFLFTAFVLTAIFANPSDFLPAIVHTFTWSRSAKIGVPLAVVLGYFIELSIAVLAVAVLKGFDRRSVNRAGVDLRVWQRQQARRRQLLRRWHQSADIPEVSQ
jgi:hypothetical protein